MQVISINVPDMFVDGFQKLIDDGVVASRSAAVRTAIDRYVAKKLLLLEALVSIKTEPAPEPPKPKVIEVIDMRTRTKGWATPTGNRVKTW